MPTWLFLWTSSQKNNWVYLFLQLPFGDFRITKIRLYKKLNKEDQIIDIEFEDFVNDQMGSVRKIYKKFGWELSEPSEKNMNYFLTQNPKDEHGAHNYSLGDFGLDEAEISDLFKPYINFLSQLKN